MNFISFFNNLAIPLKHTSQHLITIFHAIAMAFDSVQNFAEKLLLSCFVQYNHDDIELWAKERGITKITNENTKNYRERIKNSYLFNKYSASYYGLHHIISSATNKKFIIRELYKERWILGEQNIGYYFDHNNQQQYTSYCNSESTALYFIVQFTHNLSLDEKIYLDNLINHYKPSHIGYHLEATIIDDWKLLETESLGLSTYLENYEV